MEYNFSNLDALIEHDVSAGFPGAVLMVSLGGRIIKHSSYGYKLLYDRNFMTLENPEPMEKDTFFDIASNTKIFAAALIILRLASEKEININNKVKYYLPEFIHPEITIKMLLSHSSGLAPEIWFFTQNNPLGEEFFSQDKSKTEKLLLKAPLEYKPGTSTVYSDTGFMILGILIERITGIELSRCVDKLIYTPLGLKQTLFNPLEAGVQPNRIAATSFGNTCNETMDYTNIRRALIRGEVQDEKAFYSMNGIAGHAGLFSTSSDLIKMCDLIQSVYHGESSILFSRENLMEFITPDGPDKTFACGWRINRNQKAGNIFGSKASDMTIGHTGFTGTLSLTDLDNYLSIILLTNKVHSKCYDRKQYAGSNFNTGRYAPIVDAIYCALN